MWNLIVAVVFSVSGPQYLRGTDYVFSSVSGCEASINHLKTDDHIKDMVLFLSQYMLIENPKDKPSRVYAVCTENTPFLWNEIIEEIVADEDRD